MYIVNVPGNRKTLVYFPRGHFMLRRSGKEDMNFYMKLLLHRAVNVLLLEVLLLPSIT